MKKLFILLIGMCLLIPGTRVLYSGSEGDDIPPDMPMQPPTKADKNAVYGQIEYLHDVLQPNLYFMKLHDHPNGKLGVPEIYGGYASTDVYLKVQLRGVAVARDLQSVQDRARPPIYLDRERQRWDESMQYVWNIMQPTKTFRISNMEVLEEDETIEADVEVLLGGGWVNLAMLMANDHFAAVDQEGVDIDFGGRGVAPVNPNIPK